MIDIHTYYIAIHTFIQKGYAVHIFKNRPRGLIVEHRIFSPVFVDVVTVLTYTRAAPAQADRFDAEIIAAGDRIFADTLQAQLVFARLGPEVQQVIFTGRYVTAVEVYYPDELDAVKVCLVPAVVVRPRHDQQQPLRLFILDFERNFESCIILPFRPVKQMPIRIDIQILGDGLPPAVIIVGRVFAGGDDSVEIGQPALPGVRSTGLKSGLARLVPEGNAGIVVLALVPTVRLVLRVFIRRHPAVVLKGYLN